MSLNGVLSMEALPFLTMETIVLAAFLLLNIGFCGYLQIKLMQLRVEKKQIILDLEEVRKNIKALFDSARGVGNRLQTIERRTTIIEERQEELTLKEPSHLSYENAIRLVKNGESLDKIVESSGLSRGEVELLTLLSRVEGIAESA